MLKIRLMGTKNDIEWFSKLIQKIKGVNVLQISEQYANKGTSKYYRTYMEIEKESKE